MATKGIKRIRIHKKGEEGIDNSKGLEAITELNISHPRGLKPADISHADPNTLNGWPDFEFLGGNETYTINSNLRKNDEFLLGTEVKDIKLYQNNFPDTYFTASFSGINSLYDLIPVLRPAGANNTSTKNNTDIIYQFPRNVGELQYNTDVYGNHAGWWDGEYFNIQELPNTTFRVTGSVVLENSTAVNTTENIYIVLTDNGIDFNLWYDGNTGDRTTNSVYGYSLGYMLKKYPNTTVNVGDTVELAFEFMVTQSHSRIWDLPIGPSYNPTFTYAAGSTLYPNGKLNTLNTTQWSVRIASDKHYINDKSRITPTGGKLTIEPITIIDPNDSTYTELTKYGGVDSKKISGSFVQPSTNQYLSNSLASISDYVDNQDYQGGEIFRLEEIEFFNLWNQNLGVAAGSGFEVANQWISGRLSPYNMTGSSNSFKQGWRYLSVTTTSSFVPINNTSDSYNISEFNPYINNAINGRPSSIYYDVDYTRGTVQPLNRSQILNETATRAIVEDSNYSKKSWSNLRYNGSRVSSNNINQK